MRCMENLGSFLDGIKRVTSDCYSVFDPYYEARSRVYIYPVFYQSVTQMLAAGGFFYKVFQRMGRKTLAIFKRSCIMGNYSIMLHIAPISLTGNRRDEIDIMQTARQLGISLKLCPEDIQRYGIPKRLCEPIRGNVEYIYNANDCYAMDGGRFHNFRQKVRKIIRRSDYRHTHGANDDIDKLVSCWDRHNHAERIKSQQTSQLSDWKRVKNVVADSLFIHNIYVGDTLECFSVIERLSHKHWVLVMGMRNYNSVLNDVNVCMHWLDCEIAHDGNQMAVYANMGASLGIDGLSEAKEKLKPCTKQQIYRMAPIGKLDKQTIKNILS